MIPSVVLVLRGFAAILKSMDILETSKVKTMTVLIVINFVSIAVILYAFEHLFNPYPDLPPNGIVNGRLYTWGHKVENNKHGFREKDFTSPKLDGVYRVMVLGDSLTWGAGLAEEQRYTSVAEKLLNQVADDRKFEVVNFGISGGPTTVERDILRHFRHKVEPDRIVVGYCLNDPQRKSQNYSIEREELATSRIGRAVNGVSRFLLYYDLPYVGQQLNSAFYRSAEMLGVIPDWQTALQRSYEPSSDDWRIFVRALQDIKNMSDELGLPAPIFAVLNQGTFNDKPTDYRNPDQNLKRFLDWYDQAQKIAGEIGFDAYNHEYEIAQQLSDESLAINILDGHPSANLNRLYAEKLYQKIVEHVE